MVLGVCPYMYSGKRELGGEGDREKTEGERAVSVCVCVGVCKVPNTCPNTPNNPQRDKIELGAKL